MKNHRIDCFFTNFFASYYNHNIHKLEPLLDNHNDQHRTEPSSFIMGNVKSFCCKDSASDIDDNEERSRILGNNNCDNSCDDLYNNNSDNPSLQSPRDNVSYGSLNECNNKTMEQSVLDKIYQKMASNLIDVAPGESMIIQSAEFTERQRAYQVRLNQIKTPLPLKLANRDAKHVNSSLDNITVSISSLSPSSTVANNNTISSNNTSGRSSNQNVSQHLPSPIATNSGDTSRGNVANSPQEKRRVEYEPIKSDEIRLINEISLKSANAVKSFKIVTQEQVVVQFKP